MSVACRGELQGPRNVHSRHASPTPFHSPPTFEPASVREEVRELDGDRGQSQGRGGRTDRWTERKREARGQGEAGDNVRVSAEHNPW